LYRSYWRHVGIQQTYPYKATSVSVSWKQPVNVSRLSVLQTPVSNRTAPSSEFADHARGGVQHHHGHGLICMPVEYVATSATAGHDGSHRSTLHQSQNGTACLLFSYRPRLTSLLWQVFSCRITVKYSSYSHAEVNHKNSLFENFCTCLQHLFLFEFLQDIILKQTFKL
jgi:hypothetical protein